MFRVLGLPAWQTHTALVAAAGSTTELADRTGLSRTAVTSAVQTLADHGLAVSHGRTWTLGPQSLDRAGRHLDADTLVATIDAGHRADRAAWRAYLTGLHRLPAGREHRRVPAQGRRSPHHRPAHSTRLRDRDR